MATIIIELKDLGLKTTIDFGADIGNHGYSHADVINAFKTYGLRPVEKVKDLFEVIINEKFIGYIPDETFFEADVPDCPYLDTGELYYGDYLRLYGGWPPDAMWLLQKE